MEKAKKKQVLLFYCVELEDLARKIGAQSDLIQLQSINWSYHDRIKSRAAKVFLLLFRLGNERTDGIPGYTFLHVSGVLMMDSQTYSYTMHMKSKGSMLPF